MIDRAGHRDGLQSNVFETLEFDDALQVVWTWAQGRDDTLIIITADHETGGLTVPPQHVLGLVVAIERGHRIVRLASLAARVMGGLWARLSPRGGWLRPRLRRQRWLLRLVPGALVHPQSPSGGALVGS